MSRAQVIEAAEVKRVRASMDLALERLRPRMGVVVANAVLRDQLDRLDDAETRSRQMRR
jgi:hypothetical protein